MSLLTVHHFDSASLLVFVFSSVLLWWLLQESKARAFLRKMPGPPLFPIIGSVLSFRNPEDFLTTLEKFPEKYGSRARMILGSYNILLLSDLSDIEKILTSPAALPKASFYNFAIPAVGSDGIFILKGERWRERRKSYHPLFFHYRILEGFQKVFNEQSQILVEVIKEKVQAGQDAIKMHELILKCTLDVIAETAAGIKLNTQREGDNVIGKAVARQSEFIFERLVSPWLHPDLLYKYSPLGRKDAKNLALLRDFMRDAINKRKLTRKEASLRISKDEFVYKSKESNFCALDLMLQMQEDGAEGCSDEELQYEGNSVLFAGNDTTANNLVLTLFLLGSNLDAQERVHEELDSLFGTDKERPVNSTDLANLKYLECCIKESLRMYPVVPAFGRQLEDNIRLDKDCVLPKGLDIMIAPWVLHRNPELFPDPLKFKPSRHFPENCNGRNAYAYLPFSAGPRNCQGIKFSMAEEKVVLANIFRNFQVRIVDDPASMVVVPSLVLRPKGDIRFKFTIKP